MKARPRAPRRALTRVALALVCALAVCLGAAAAAPAAPPEPTLTVAQLQALLDASPGGTLEGYFKTVLKGSDIVQIPVTVKSTVPYSIPEGSLILFQAKGPAIEEIGGIAHGMSGSPLYVVGQGGDTLVGRGVVRRHLHARLPRTRHARRVHGRHGRHLPAEPRAARASAAGQGRRGHAVARRRRALRCARRAP